LLMYHQILLCWALLRLAKLQEAALIYSCVKTQN
jgi:hypothetical protein